MNLSLSSHYDSSHETRYLPGGSTVGIITDFRGFQIEYFKYSSSKDFFSQQRSVSQRMNLSLSSHYDSSHETRYLPEGSTVGTITDFDAVFDVGDVIGRGQSSVVRAVRRKDNGEVFACKFVDKFSLGTQRIRDEIKVLMTIRHPNIVTLHAVYETNRDLRLVVDLVQGGELFDRIVAKKVYSEREACLVVTQLLGAVAFLHNRNIIHRDIKPENILLASKESDTDISLTDFGLVKIFEESTTTNTPALSSSGDFATAVVDSEMVDVQFAQSPKPARRQRAYTTVGTDYYIAPEILNGEGYTTKVDLWSVGVVGYILLCGFPPFTDPDVSRVYQRIRDGRFDFPSPFWDNVSEIAKDLIKRLLTVDPEQRISAPHALVHPWIVSRSMQVGDSPLSPQYATMFRKFNSKRRSGF